ncbi:methyltransferase [Kribbella sp. VKM Ac-2568]|uniref:methyltransferase n=1 Tax=Kribbella sp. VKM Ac-2568 TaxID=2512219 RepID=UPI00104976CD|nr:methyltransferase [Kribbella sp. VKM Ac-2568]TCM50473.1 methyltransferase family protein [Kribbella sp. VKM Ac-2568]
MDSLATLQSMVTGFRTSAALSVAAELGLSDELAREPRTAADLAKAVGADEDTLRRLLRALVAVGVYAEHDGAYSNTAVGAGLRSNVAGSLRPLARTLQDPALWAAWGQLGHSVRTGENAFEALHGYDVWTHRQGQPEHNAIFNDNMAALTSSVAAAVAAAYDFSGRSSVVDIGGGQGILLEAVLTAYEHLSGTVFDLSHVVATKPRSPALESRWSSVAGSFFESVPPADAYLLKSILHDWPDDRCVEILRTCTASLNPGGVVLVVELILGRTGQEVLAAFSDLNMLVLPGGRERTETEYAALFTAAGLRLNRVLDTNSRMSILEAITA